MNAVLLSFPAPLVTSTFVTSNSPHDGGKKSQKAQLETYNGKVKKQRKRALLFFAPNGRIEQPIAHIQTTPIVKPCLMIFNATIGIFIPDSKYFIFFSLKKSFFKLLFFNKNKILTFKVCFYKTVNQYFKYNKPFAVAKLSINKHVLLFLDGVLMSCTFVLLIVTNETTPVIKAHRSETFHEIIYGKPPRRKRAPRFFLSQNCAVVYGIIEVSLATALTSIDFFPIHLQIPPTWLQMPAYQKSLVLHGFDILYVTVKNPLGDTCRFAVLSCPPGHFYLCNIKFTTRWWKKEPEGSA